MLSQAIATLPLAFIGGLGPWEIMIVGIIAVLLFGKRLPDVARSMGKSFVEFKKGMSGIEDEVRSATYAADSASTYDAHQAAIDDHEEATAPKFEPPSAAPESAPASTGSETKDV